MKLTKRSNPSLLALLQMGCRITFPDTRFLQGDPQNGYIEIGITTFTTFGLWCLDRQGLANALTDPDFQPETGEEE